MNYFIIITDHIIFLLIIVTSLYGFRYALHPDKFKPQFSHVLIALILTAIAILAAAFS